MIGIASNNKSDLVDQLNRLKFYLFFRLKGFFLISHHIRMAMNIPQIQNTPSPMIIRIHSTL